ncbi:MAG: Fic family protein [Thermoplasmata archaeon]|nr:Fic family protein [Thermoplasmata archaeon]
MAASAAKYGHCQPRYPVEYRPKAPFRPWIVAPLDFTARAAALYLWDHELDRAILEPADLAAVLEEELWSQPGPGGIFRAEASAARRPAARMPVSAGPFRRQFLLNALRLARESTRFRPPWNLALVQDVHTTLLRELGVGPEPGALRTTPRSTRDPDGFTLQMNCPPAEIPADMEAVLAWIDRFGPSYHPIVPATVLLQSFHSIRPFPVGSMTTARALAVLYLHFHGLANAELAPFSSADGRDPRLLYRLLLWTESTGSYTELIDHTLDTTLRAYESSVRRWLRPERREGALEEVAVRLLARARRTPGWFSAREAGRWVGGRRGPTVLKHLNRLVERGVRRADPGPTVPPDLPGLVLRRPRGSVHPPAGTRSGPGGDAAEPPDGKETSKSARGAERRGADRFGLAPGPPGVGGRDLGGSARGRPLDQAHLGPVGLDDPFDLIARPERQRLGDDLGDRHP